jgi:hypothetical protein
MAYLASRVGVTHACFVGVAVAVVLADSIYQGVDSIHNACQLTDRLLPLPLPHQAMRFVSNGPSPNEGGRTQTQNIRFRL